MDDAVEEHRGPERALGGNLAAVKKAAAGLKKLVNTYIWAIRSGLGGLRISETLFGDNCEPFVNTPLGEGETAVGVVKDLGRWKWRDEEQWRYPAGTAAVLLGKTDASAAARAAQSAVAKIVKFAHNNELWDKLVEVDPALLCLKPRFARAARMVIHASRLAPPGGEGGGGTRRRRKRHKQARRRRRRTLSKRKRAHPYSRSLSNRDLD
jgi:hypothetical protein